MNLKRWAVLASIGLALTACGGGGGGGSGGSEPPPASNPPPATPSADDLAKAQNARVRMELNFAPLLSPSDPPTRAGLMTITWLDTFDNELGYQVERRLDTGDWQVLDTLPALDGGSGNWERYNPTESGNYWVSANFRDFSLPLSAAPGESEVNVDPTAAPALRMEQQDDGGLRVSVTNAAPARSVEYFLGSYLFGAMARVANVTTGDDFAATLPAQRILGDPALSLSVRIHKSAGLTIRHGSLALFRSPETAVLLHVGPATTAANSLVLTARASSSSNIASVQFFANGLPLQQLDAPDRSGNWVHAFDPAILPSNVNTFRAVATDAAGNAASMDVQYTLETSPALTVEGVFDGMIVTGGRLRLGGSFGENMPGSVLSIDLGSKNSPILRTRTSPFQLDYPVAELSADRMLTLRAESPTGEVATRTYRIVLPSTDRAYELIATDAAELLAADAGVLLYRKHSGEVLMRNAAGVETQLQLPAGLHFSHWWLAAGKVVARERVNGHLHVFTGPGQTLDLTPSWALDGVLPLLTVRGDWLTFPSGPFRFSAHHLPDGATISFSPAASSLNLQTDIDTTPGAERVLFSGTIDGVPGVYAHGLTTGVTELMLGGAYDAVRTDGARLVARAGQRIDVAPLSSPASATTLANEGSLYFAQDGLIGFSYVNDSNELIGVAVNDGSSTLPLAVYGSTDDKALRDGDLIFSGSGAMRNWNSTTGSTLVLDALAESMHTRGVVYLLTGGSPSALYRTTLP